VKYETTAGFDNDFSKLPREHRALFMTAVTAHLLPALASGAHRGEAPWPRRLRIHKIADTFSLTWSFAGPDGRALFVIRPGADDIPVLTWLAIGYHDIIASRVRQQARPAGCSFTPA